jgi:pimeloyl-ACP methyl ester carboxylesterase
MKSSLLRLVLVLASLMFASAQALADSPKPTIVLVHGAFADGSSWDRVVPLLMAKGYDVVAVHQPLSGLADDVAAVKRVVDAQPGDVVLVGHSYGGVIITEVGNDPKVKKLVYVAAFGPDAGESINDLGKGGPPPEWIGGLKVVEGYGMLTPDTVVKFFAQDLPKADQTLIAAKEGWLAMSSLEGKPTAAAWKSKPSWYIVAAQDHMIPPAAEEQMAKRMNAKVTTLKTSHVPMLSKPKEVAGVILDAAAAK